MTVRSENNQTVFQSALVLCFFTKLDLIEVAYVKKLKCFIGFPKDKANLQKCI